MNEPCKGGLARGQQWSRVPWLFSGQRLGIELRFRKYLSGAIMCLAPIEMFSPTFFSNPQHCEVENDAPFGNEEPPVPKDSMIC